MELGQVNTEAIEHREDNWSKRRLLLDVGATDADDKVSGLPVASADVLSIDHTFLQAKSSHRIQLPTDTIHNSFFLTVHELGGHAEILVTQDCDTKFCESVCEAHVLTDGLAGAERRMIGIIGLHQKSARERNFPLGLLEKGLKVKIEAAWMLDFLCNLWMLSLLNQHKIYGYSSLVFISFDLV